MAPEPALAERLRQHYDCVSIDRETGRADASMDLTALAFDDSSFHVVVCNHVLEHVPDDRKAMSELYRVLKPGGWGSLQVPMKGSCTIEDSGVTDPLERQRLFGQADHVRQYGHDYPTRLREIGYKVQVIQRNQRLSVTEAARFAIESESKVVLVRKPAMGTAHHPRR